MRAPSVGLPDLSALCIRETPQVQTLLLSMDSK